MNEKKYQRVYIEWIDSTMSRVPWHEYEDIIESGYFNSQKHITLAYLIFENKDEYIFSSSIYLENEEVATVGQVFTIPKGCVTKFEYLER